MHSLLIAFFALLITVNGLNITKYGSAAQRAVTDQARNITVWVYFLVVPVYGEYLESISIYSLIQLTGFIILLLGVLLYNEIIVASFCCLSDHLMFKKKLVNLDAEYASKKNRQSLN